MEKRLFSLLLFLCSLLLFPKPVLAGCVQPKQTASVDYAPYLFYQNYVYYGEGNEFAGHQTALIYQINDDKIYQFRIDGGGTSIAYVYQINDDGIYELSYFPDEYGLTDYRLHPDTVDDLRSLIFPAKFVEGEIFYSGYSQQFPILVEDILDTYTLGGTTYNDVVVLSRLNEEGYEDRNYYAPHIGLIYEEFILKDSSDFKVTEQLTKYENKMDLSKIPLDLCQ